MGGHAHYATLFRHLSGDGVVILAVPNLPTELPRESSEHFAKALLPLVNLVVRSDASVVANANVHLNLAVYHSWILLRTRRMKDEICQKNSPEQQ